jgi:NAD(P)-dependent dehydrogenase (short-subunit alcohol dehydrogenase family)
VSSATPAERFDLTGRVALVTGGSRGLGRAISLGLAAAGADIVVSRRKLGPCEETAAEVQELGRRALPIACNVSSWAETDRLVEQAYEHFGRVDVLVNNAGMSPAYDSVATISEALYDKVMAVNLKGPFRLMAMVGERMRDAGGGTVVNISSVGADRPTRDIVAYAAAKAGLNAMTVAFADAYGPEVRVNGIMPGPFLTDISASWDMDAFARASRAFPLRRAGEPDEIVGAVLYLASAASSYTTGTTLAVDGGAMWASSILDEGSTQA